MNQKALKDYNQSLKRADDLRGRARLLNVKAAKDSVSYAKMRYLEAQADAAKARAKYISARETSKKPRKGKK